MAYIKQWVVNGTTYDIKAVYDGAGNTITSKYVTLDTSQSISAYKSFQQGALVNTNTDTTPFYISRTGGTGEAVAHSVNDSQYTICYTNDETSSSVRLRLINTDTEDGTKDNTTDYSYYFNSSGTITGTSFTGNSATATALATTRTIWGQNFNGTGNITGHMYNLGGQFRLASDDRFSFLTSSSGAAYGSFKGLFLSDSYSNSTTYRFHCVGNGYFQETLYMGYRRTSTAPTSGIAVNHFCLTPPYHTGGPWYINCYDDSSNAYLRVLYGSSAIFNIRHDGVVTSNKIYNAVWNDYAEYRIANENEPGRVVMEDDHGVLQKATRRLQPFAGVISDTFGFAEGETDEAKTPLAVAGRVLVYPHDDRHSYKPGDCVCADEGGTVSIMTRDEIIKWPDRIVGTVSEIPEYEHWGTGNVEVNGRIWIKVK